ncbi:amino acid ABC transporter substrate-binding protein [Cohnella lubricantis]|uniref:Amino acid ABC transporter substrate-binding protein n=1 Tax=Cohnella lubricantis TaxID=2163172 RepID=A0A841T933_9BACL|nr:amino acid ABC transporter substrate-binding protein [Cohnella lubricantis]MBB6678023.1 amino acid ABC transporter substrate-binding protein [Cohnella lubricantis]MBP2118142.1 cystine transport system substrate-binding protein [Cohnella lubricantis]
MRRTAGLGLTLLTVAALALAGCGNQTDNNTAENGGKLRIGTEGTYAPFTYHDENGKLTGFDVEIAAEVSKRMGLQPEFVETAWDGMIAGLDAGRFDTIFNEVSVTDERKEKYDFSDPYIVSKAVLIVKENNTDITKLADLKGKKSAQSLTSNLGQIAKANGAEIVGVEGFNQSIELLLSGRVDATVNDSLSYFDYKKQQPDAPIKMVDEASDASQSAALFKKGNDELVQAVNQALADMKQDGTYLKISQKYFGADVSQ